MKTKAFSDGPFAPLSEAEAALVVGGAGLPLGGFWRKLLTTAVELGLEALLKEWKRHFMERQRGVS